MHAFFHMDRSNSTTMLKVHTKKKCRSSVVFVASGCLACNQRKANKFTPFLRGY